MNNTGYPYNSDQSFTKPLLESLETNKKRYGYPSCPCRLASGNKENDKDIICPCDYRDADLAEYGTCYCGLYVTPKQAASGKSIASIPERRKQKKTSTITVNRTPGSLTYPVWRCQVCGYLCARDQAPATCPVCQAEQDRFERFM